LRASKPDVTHPDAPIVFLFYHAIELYLKAFLRNAGYDLQKLKSISHSIIKAGHEAEAAGLQLTPADFEVLQLIDSYDNVIRTRYITTGAYSRPEDEELSDFCKHLDRSVGERLAKDGHPVHAKSFSAAGPAAGRQDNRRASGGRNRNPQQERARNHRLSTSPQAAPVYLRC
jgi:hypothetical protein